MNDAVLFVGVLGVFGAIGGLCINTVQPEAYMVTVSSVGCRQLCAVFIALVHECAARWCVRQDEPFHVAQTRAYCFGNWTHWEPLLTTFPGTFLTAAPLGAAAFAVWPEAGLCTVRVLRAVGWLYAAGVAVLAASLTRHARGKQFEGGTYPRLVGAAVVFMPMAAQSTVLFYTDVGALFWVLLCYRLALVQYRGPWTFLNSGLVRAADGSVLCRVGVPPHDACWGACCFLS